VVALEVPTIVAAKKSRRPKPEHQAAAKLKEVQDDERKSAIVTARSPGKRYAEVPDMTEEEHKRRGDAATALWRELMRPRARGMTAAHASPGSSSPQQFPVPAGDPSR